LGSVAIQLGIQQYDPEDDQFQPDISHKKFSDQDAIIYKINLRDEFYDENNKPFENTKGPNKIRFTKRSLIEDDIQNLNKDDICYSPSIIQYVDLNDNIPQ
jgi:hypothetical protein